MFYIKKITTFATSNIYNMDLATVKIYGNSKKKLKRLAERYEKSELNFLSTSIDYIYKTGLNVYSNEVENVPDLIFKLENRIISFMKKREQDFFVPMSKKTQELVDSHINLTDHLKAFDVIKFATEQEENKKKAPNFIVPKENGIFGQEDKNNENLGLIEASEEELHQTSNSTFEIEQIKNDLERAEKKVALFKDNLQFIYDRISKAGGFSSSKFSLNITERDYERIRQVLENN